MSDTVPDTQPDPWSQAARAACLLAVDPAGLGGAVVRAGCGPVRDSWLALLTGCLPPGTKQRKIPATIGDDALLGGIDLAATLRAGRPIASAGLLAEAAGGLVIGAMAERMPPGLAARLSASLDGECRVALVALDEGVEEERAPQALLERLAFHLDFSALSHRDVSAANVSPADIAAAKARLGSIVIGDEALETLCGTALALGVYSPRASILAVRAARAAAALAGNQEVSLNDAALAASLVLGPRATRLPSPPPPPDPSDTEEPDPESPPDSPPESPPDSPPDQAEASDSPENSDLSAAEMVLEAAKAAIPAGLLARLQAKDFRPQNSATQGQAGALQKSNGRGRPAGVRAAAPGHGLRLNLIETLRAAAPWQRVREPSPGAGMIKLRREDFRVTRTQQRARTTTIFLVDASGSAALARLAEAKGAVELLLADCYQRRDQVAVIAFRGKTAQILLPPTRSLVRAKRSLAGLPGGGGTPMAAAIDAGFLLAQAERRAGATPTLVFLTDGRANVTRAGTGGRAQAQAEASQSAQRLRLAGFAAVLLDTSARPDAQAEALAAAMGGRYVPLPYVNAASVNLAVRASMSK